MKDDAGTGDVRRIDGKGAGYMISMASVLLLGAAAWPKPGSPAWHLWVLVAGMILSIAGMALRYRAYLHERREREGTWAGSDGN